MVATLKQRAGGCCSLLLLLACYWVAAAAIMKYKWLSDLGVNVCNESGSYEEVKFVIK